MKNNSPTKARLLMETAVMLAISFVWLWTGFVLVRALWIVLASI